MPGVRPLRLAALVLALSPGIAASQPEGLARLLRRIAEVHGGTARQLTSGEGEELFPRFSPDGRTIAFTSYLLLEELRKNPRKPVTVPPAPGHR